MTDKKQDTGDINNINLSQEEIKNIQIDNIKEIINNFKDINLENEITNIDGNSKLSDTEKKILDKLSNANDKIVFLGELINYIKQNKKTDTLDKIGNIFENIGKSSMAIYKNTIHNSVENINFVKLYKKLEKSKNIDEETQNTIAALLSYGQALLNGSKSTPYNKIFEKAYYDFTNEIEKGIQDKNFSIESNSYKMIEGKYFNLVTLQSRFNIQAKGIISGSLSKLTGEVEKKKEIANKSIDNYTVDEAKWALEMLNINYNDYVNRTTNDFGSDTLSSLDGKADTNNFQQKLINKIMGTDEGFSGDYLQGYNNEKGNFIVNISDFLTNIKTINVENINSHVLVNFFKQLTKGYRINILELKALFGEIQLKKLKKVWNSNKNSNIAKNYLLENNLGYIIEMMDKDLDYYASLSTEELNTKLQIVTDKNENLRIKNNILYRQINEKINLSNRLGIKNDELEKIKKEYIVKNDTNESNKHKILHAYNKELALNIKGEIAKKVGTTGDKLVKELGINTKISEKNDEDDETEDDTITLEELLNKLQEEKNINKVLLIITKLKSKESDILLNGDKDLTDISLIDEYLNKLSSNPNKNLKQINNIISNLDLFRSQGLCPKSETVINLKKSTIQSNEIQNKIKTNIDNIYPNGENMGDKLINLINKKLENAKNGKKYCFIQIIQIIKEFDKENAKYRKNPNEELKIKNLKDLTGDIIQNEKEKIDKRIRHLLFKAGKISIDKINSNQFSNIATLGSVLKPDNNYTLEGNLILRGLNINQIDNLPNLTIEEKEELKKLKPKLESVDKSQKNLYSYSDKEFKDIIKGINEGKDPFEIQEEIEKNREKNTLNQTKTTQENNTNTNINTNNYKITLNSTNSKITLESGKEIKISQNEANMIKNNPETAKNIINFHDTLVDVGLSQLWNYREQISTSLGSLNGLNINNNDDSLNENELKIFLNAILKSVGKKEIKTNSNIEQFKNLFKIENNYQVLGDGYKNNSNKIGSSDIEEQFMEKYIIGFPKFKSSLFQSEIQK